MARNTTTLPKKTAFHKLVSKKASYCAGKATKADVKVAERLYKLNAVTKATKAAKAGDKVKAAKVALKKATAVANRILKGGCKMSSSIAGKKKKKTAAKKTATKRKTTTKRKTK